MRIMRRNESTNVCREHGATMVEFAVCLILFLLLLGVFFDLGLALHNWMLLRTATLEATRQTAVSFVTKPDCHAVEDYLVEKASPRLRKELGADAAVGKLQWSVNWMQPAAAANAAPTFPTLRITGQFPVSCYFLCHLFPDGFLLSATSETVVEYEHRLDQSCNVFSVSS